jgi:hypothetical protein
LSRIFSIVPIAKNSLTTIQYHQCVPLEDFFKILLGAIGHEVGQNMSVAAKFGH